MNTKKPKLSPAARALIKDIRGHRKTRHKIIKEISIIEAQVDKLNGKLTLLNKRSSDAEAKAVDTITHLVGALVECGFEPEAAFNYATEIK